jgi:hypothetical protein
MYKGKQKSFMIRSKTDILAKADKHTGMHVDQTLELGLRATTLNATVNNCEATGRS